MQRKWQIKNGKKKKLKLLLTFGNMYGTEMIVVSICTHHVVRCGQKELSFWTFVRPITDPALT